MESVCTEAAQVKTVDDPPELTQFKGPREGSLLLPYEEDCKNGKLLWSDFPEDDDDFGSDMPSSCIESTASVSVGATMECPSAISDPSPGLDHHHSTEDGESVYDDNEASHRRPSSSSSLASFGTSFHTSEEKENESSKRSDDSPCPDRRTAPAAATAATPPTCSNNPYAQKVFATLQDLASRHKLRRYRSGWSVLTQLWGLTPRDFDAVVLHRLALKSPQQQEQILLSFATIPLATVENLSAFLNSTISEHEMARQVCMLFLGGVCSHTSTHDGYVHPSNTLGWNALSEKWNLTFRDFDYTVLNYLSKQSDEQQDQILSNLAAINLHNVHNLSAYLSCQIQNAEQREWEQTSQLQPHAQYWSMPDQTWNPDTPPNCCCSCSCCSCDPYQGYPCESTFWDGYGPSCPAGVYPSAEIPVPWLAALPLPPPSPPVSQLPSFSQSPSLVTSTNPCHQQPQTNKKSTVESGLPNTFIGVFMKSLQSVIKTHSAVTATSSSAAPLDPSAPRHHSPHPHRQPASHHKQTPSFAAALMQSTKPRDPKVAVSSDQQNEKASVTTATNGSLNHGEHKKKKKGGNGHRKLLRGRALQSAEEYCQSLHSFLLKDLGPAQAMGI